MKTNKLVLTSILLAIGTVLRITTPGIIGGVKPDFLLALMFVTIIINNDLRYTIVIGIVSGLLAAMTTNFPGGQIPQLVDKFFTSLLFYYLYRNTEKILNDKNLYIKTGTLFFIATLFSGGVFLLAALLTFGLPNSIGVLFISIVLPTGLLNIIFGNFAYKLYLTIYKKRLFA